MIPYSEDFQYESLYEQRAKYLLYIEGRTDDINMKQERIQEPDYKIEVGEKPEEEIRRRR